MKKKMQRKSSYQKTREEYENVIEKQKKKKEVCSLKFFFKSDIKSS